MKAGQGWIAAAASLATIVPQEAQAQSMGGMSMPGMSMPAPAKKKAAVKATPKKPAFRKSGSATVPRHRSAAAARLPGNRAATKPPSAHSSMPSRDHSAMPGMDHPAMPKMNGAAMPGMDHSAMPGMPGQLPASSAASSAPMDHGTMSGMDMGSSSGQPDMAAMPGMTMPNEPSISASGTALPAGSAPAPAPPMDHYADRLFPSAEMDMARMSMMREQGGRNFHQVMFNLAEFQARQGRDGYRWDGGAWFGGDINRLRVKTEGEGAFRQGVDSAEVQALYSRAVGPYFNLQAGIRQDFQPTPRRTYATIGVEGLAPYMFEVEGAAFLSNKGDVLGRLEGYYDQRITQRLILQPRVELNLSAQDVPEIRIGSGITNAELGLRLRYEISREFAPYLGVSYDRKLGDTARFARADGERVQATSFVAGVRFWF